MHHPVTSMQPPRKADEQRKKKLEEAKKKDGLSMTCLDDTWG